MTHSPLPVETLLAGFALATAVLPLLVFLTNIPLFRRPCLCTDNPELLPVSVLIPARNEERSIVAAVQSVLASRDVTLELIVLDDGSTDRTATIVRELAHTDVRLRLEQAPALPAGWNGKQYACWHLASLAQYPVFCFLDADVRLGALALQRMLTELHPDSTGMVTGFPRQQTETWMEWLLLPLIHFLLLGFLPLIGERCTRRVGFAAGCGQFLMVRRAAYFRTGGHSAIRTTMHDGLLLPRLFRRHGIQTQVYDLTVDAVCRMYRSASEVWRGLSKNATEGIATPARIAPFTLLLAGGTGSAAADTAVGAHPRRRSPLSARSGCLQPGSDPAHRLGGPLPPAHAQRAAASRRRPCSAGAGVERAGAQAAGTTGKLEGPQLSAQMKRRHSECRRAAFTSPSASVRNTRANRPARQTSAPKPSRGAARPPAEAGWATRVRSATHRL